MKFWTSNEGRESKIRAEMQTSHLGDSAAARAVRRKLKSASPAPK